MPTVLRIDGVRVAVYPNDHESAHVHVIGPGWIVIVNPVGPKVRDVIGCDAKTARDVLRLVRDRQSELMAAWRRFHG